MKLELRNINHPTIKNRNITLIFIDDELDLPSSYFLIHEARYGGRHGNIAGSTSHRGRAIKISELYRNLNEMGKTWRNAEESDIKMIRNFMLCWDANDALDEDYYEHEPISNDAMNQKLGVWFKFYRYMNQIDEPCRMKLSTKTVTVSLPDHLLNHVDKTGYGNRKKMVEIWRLKVKSSPKRPTYHALTEDEYDALRRHLKEQDPVFAMIADLMVETGLRVSAALDVEVDSFRCYFVHLNNGMKMNECIKMKYTNKGGEEAFCDLPLRAIYNIQYNYLASLYGERLVKHDHCSENGKYEYNQKNMWLLKNGKVVNYDDIRKAFKNASIKMGRKAVPITPHWLRHTFACWTLISFAEDHNLPLKNTGVKPNEMFMILLSEKLGHATILTTYKYIATALKLMGVGAHKGPKMSYQSLVSNKKAQELVTEKAKKEFGDDFDPKVFNVFKYALTRKLAVKDD